MEFNANQQQRPTQPFFFVLTERQFGENRLMLKGTYQRVVQRDGQFVIDDEKEEGVIYFTLRGTRGDGTEYDNTQWAKDTSALVSEEGSLLIGQLPEQPSLELDEEGNVVVTGTSNFINKVKAAPAAIAALIK